MTDPRSADTTPLDAPDVDVTEMAQEIAGSEPRRDQDGILDTSQVDVADANATETAFDEGESGVIGADDPIDSVESLELLEDQDLRSDETNDAELASEEGLSYVAPIDPPIVPSGDQGAQIAAGFGGSALDDPYDDDHLETPVTASDEMTERVRDAIRADASTSAYADTIEIETSGARVMLRGVVDDLEDDDNLVAVASTVAGVDEVIDRLEVAGL
jgi:hypothetical protein